MDCRTRIANRPELCGLIILALLLAWGCGSENETPTDPGGGDSNTAPVASAGADRTVSAGLSVQLDGSASSDADGDPLTYSWMLNAPSGSSAALDEPTSVTPSFLPDVPGAYTARLTVSDASDSGTPDEVTVTAEDNTVAATVGVTGGEIFSSDGNFQMVIPAGAIDTETEIRVTLAGPGQVPPEIADLPWSGAVVYDLQPSGLTFNVPLELSVEIGGAVIAAGDSTTIVAATMIVESDGVLESARETTLRRSESDTTAVTLTGGISHFSSIAVVKEMDILYTLAGPARATVGESFDARFSATKGILGGEFDFDAGHLTDISGAPVVPDPEAPEGYLADLSLAAPGILQGANRYVCTGPGDGSVAAVVDVDLDPTSPVWSVLPSVSLDRNVTCVAPEDPIDPTVISGAAPLSSGRTGNEIIIAGSMPMFIDLQTGATTPLGDSFGGDPLVHLHAVGDRLYGNTLLGAEAQWSEAGGWSYFSQPFPDQLRSAVSSPDGNVYGASGTGSAMSVGFDAGEGGLVRTDWVLPNIQALWGSDGTSIAVETGGDGNSTFNASYLTLVTQVGEALSSVPLAGGVMNEILDQYQRLRKDLNCTFVLEAVVACAFLAGELNPGDLVDGQDERDGYHVTFLVDLVLETAELLESRREPAVGASAFAIAGLAAVAYANQLTNTAEFRGVNESGELAWSRSIQLAQWCNKIIDLAVDPAGTFFAVSCLEGPEPESEARTIYAAIPSVF